MAQHLIRLKLDIEPHVADQLTQAARLANRASNAAMRCWVRWHEDHPGWQPTPKMPRGKPKLKKNGEPELEHPGFPLELGRLMYDATKRCALALHSTIRSSVSSGLQANLRGKMPYDHHGECKERWRAILAYEASPPTARAMAFPLHNRITSLVIDDHGIAAHAGLWSKQSGREERSVRLAVASKEMPAGLRRNLRRIAEHADGFKHSDSMLVCKDDGRHQQWFLNLCYERPDVFCAADVKKTATLWPAPPAWNYLFALEMPDGQMLRIGSLAPYAAEYRRLLLRKKAIQFRYRDGLRKGRGRRRIFRTTKPLGRAMRDLEDHVRKLAASDIVRAMMRDRIGSLLYREPSRGLRDLLAVAKAGLPWDWTAMAGMLNARVLREGGLFEGTPKDRIKLAAHCEKFLWKPREAVGEADANGVPV